MVAWQEAYERCQSFIASNFVDAPRREAGKGQAVALSRQPYSGSHAVAEQLIGRLESEPGQRAGSWALFDRDLVRRILEDHGLPEAVARYMPEDRDHEFTGLINEILGVHPSLWDLFHYTCETVARLAQVGNVVLIGRGAHIVTRGMEGVLQVRLVAPLEQRVQRCAQLRGIPADQARREAVRADHASAAYLRSHFDESPDDPGAYHLVLNLGRLETAPAAALLREALKNL